MTFQASSATDSLFLTPNIRKTRSSAQGNSSAPVPTPFSTPTPRPTPRFIAESGQFSSKKKNEHYHTPLQKFVPRAPAKTAPVWRTCSKLSHEPARILSFLPKHQQPSLNPHYDASNTSCLYKDQIYTQLEVAGQGCFGQVVRVREHSTGKISVIKNIPREVFEANRTRQLEEVRLHELLPPHNNCVRLIKAWQERDQIYMEMEPCQGSLQDLITKNYNADVDFTETECWSFLLDMLQALRHLHRLNLVHMDIKPANIMVDNRLNCKLGDFGLMFNLEEQRRKEGKRAPLQPSDGDSRYLAPEALQDKYDKAADIYSLGVTILELSTDLYLDTSACRLLREGSYPDTVDSLSRDLQSALRAMLSPEPKNRASVEQLLALPAVRKAARRQQLWRAWHWVWSRLLRGLEWASIFSRSLRDFAQRQPRPRANPRVSFDSFDNGSLDDSTGSDEVAAGNPVDDVSHPLSRRTRYGRRGCRTDPVNKKVLNVAGRGVSPKSKLFANDSADDTPSPSKRRKELMSGELELLSSLPLATGDGSPVCTRSLRSQMPAASCERDKPPVSSAEDDDDTDDVSLPHVPPMALNFDDDDDDEEAMEGVEESGGGLAKKGNEALPECTPAVPGLVSSSKTRKRPPEASPPDTHPVHPRNLLSAFEAASEESS